MRLFYRSYYLLRDVVQGLVRHPGPNLATLLLLAVAIFAFSSSLMIADALQGLSGYLEAQSKMRAFLDESADDEVISKAAEQIRALEPVGRVTVETPQVAEQRFRGSFAGLADFLDAFESSPFPSALLIELRPDSDPAKVASQVLSVPGVAEVVWPQEYLPRLLDLSRTFRQTAIVVVSGLFGIALLVTVLAVQLNVRNRHDEITLRLLIGSSPLAVRCQFAIEAALIGALGGLVGSVFAEKTFLTFWQALERSLPVWKGMAMGTPADSSLILTGAIISTLLAFAAGILATWRWRSLWSDVW